MGIGRLVFAVFTLGVCGGEAFGRVKMTAPAKANQTDL
jgi:hypothetical protein